MSEATQTENPSLEQTLNRTDLGHTIYEYRKPLLALLAAILIGATGYVIWKQTQKSKALETAEEVFQFQSKTWVDAKAGKTEPAVLVQEFNKLDKEVQTSPAMVPVVLDMSKFLYDKGALTEAEAILSQAATSNTHSLTTFFINMQRAVVLEKLGKSDEAISVLEKLAQKKDVLMAPKVSLELGRLYLAKGEKGKAQTQFDYIINTFPNDEQAKVAKLYLSKLAE